MTQSLHQRLGSLVLPPNVGTVEDAQTLTSLDPARRILTDLFKAAINAELGAAWRASPAGGMPPDGPISPEYPVADTLELEPSKAHMLERQGGFPLLAVYRNGTGEYQAEGIGELRLVQPWMVDWVLGPASIAQKFQLGDTAVAVAKVIALTIRKQGHPSYQGGALQFGDETSGITSIRVVRHTGPGVARFADEQDAASYWAITIELETHEYAGESPGLPEFGPLDGASYDFGIGEQTGVIPGLLYADTDAPGT